MPIKQMPYGLLDFNIRFFAKGSTQNLGIEEHYASWLATMFSHFGHKWLCLHRGPGWQYEVSGKLDSVELEGSLSDAVDSSVEDTVGELDIIQSALQESSLCLDDFDWTSDTLDNSNPVSPVPENPGSFQDIVHVPHLWTHVDKSHQQDMELGFISSQEMEKLHRIQPSGHSKKQQHPGLYDPLKVCSLFFYLWMIKNAKVSHCRCLALK